MPLRLPGRSPDRSSGFYRRGSVWGDTGVTTLGATNQIKHLIHELERGTVVVSHYKKVEAGEPLLRTLFLARPVLIRRESFFREIFEL